MKAWKAALGLGTACAACCTVPLVGGAAAFAAGSASLAAAGSALLACADEFMPLALALLAMAAVGAATLLWRKRAQRLANVQLAAAQGPPTKACGCPPGQCG